MIHIVNGRVDNGDDSVMSACGVELSTWDKPVQYVFPETGYDKATCPTCRELVTPPKQLSPEELQALKDRVSKKFGIPIP